MWHKVIPEICMMLDELGVKYHADASSSLYVNGFEFEMDDFDVTVEWGAINRVRMAFAQEQPSEITGSNPKQFYFKFLGCKIDVMSYENETGIGPESERHIVLYSGTEVWSKKPSFYLNRMRKDHPIRNAALQHFKMDHTNLGCRTNSPLRVKFPAAKDVRLKKLKDRENE